MSRQPKRRGRGNSWHGSDRRRPGQEGRPSQSTGLIGQPPEQNNYQGIYGTRPDQYQPGSGQYGSWTGQYESGTGQYRPGIWPEQYGPGPGQYGPREGQYGSGPEQYGPRQGQYGSGPGQYGPGQGQYGPGQGQYGSGPGQYGPRQSQYGSGPGRYGPGQVQYGPGQGQYGPGQGQYGSGPGQYGPGQGQYGSGPEQHGPGQEQYGPGQCQNGPGSNKFEGGRGGREKTGHRNIRKKEFGSQSSLASEGGNFNTGRRKQRVEYVMSEFGSQSSLTSERGGRRGRRGRKDHESRDDKMKEFGSSGSLATKGGYTETEGGTQANSQNEDSDSQLSHASEEESSKRGKGRRGVGYERRQRGRGRGQWERRGRGNNRRGSGQVNVSSQGGSNTSKEEEALLGSFGPSDQGQQGRGRTSFGRRGGRPGRYRGSAGRGRVGSRGGSRRDATREEQSMEQIFGSTGLGDLVDVGEQKWDGVVETYEEGNDNTEDLTDRGRNIGERGQKLISSLTEKEETGSESDISNEDVNSRKSIKPRTLGSRKKHVVVGKGLSKVGKGKIANRTNPEKKPKIGSIVEKMSRSEKSHENGIGDLLKALQNVSSKYVEDGNDGELFDVEEAGTRLVPQDEAAGGPPALAGRRRRVSSHENKPGNQVDPGKETPEDEIDVTKAFKTLLSEFGGRATMFELQKKEAFFPPSFFDNLWLKKHRNKFMIFEKNGSVQFVSIFNPKAKLCVYFNEPNGCKNEECGYFHVCNGFVSETCKPHIKKCPRTHNFFEGQNNHLIKQFGFELYKNKEISKIIRRSVPEICKAYNQGVTHEQDTCPDLHLCERVLFCKQNSCMLEHRYQSTDHNRWVLACFRLSHYKPHLLMKMILGQKRENQTATFVKDDEDLIEDNSSSSAEKLLSVDIASAQGAAHAADSREIRGVDKTSSHHSSLQTEKLTGDHTQLRGDISQIRHIPGNISESPTQYQVEKAGAPSASADMNSQYKSRTSYLDGTSQSDAGSPVDAMQTQRNALEGLGSFFDAEQLQHRGSSSTSPIDRQHSSEARGLVFGNFPETPQTFAVNAELEKNALLRGTSFEQASSGSPFSTANEDRPPNRGLSREKAVKRIAAGQFLCEKHIWGTCTDSTSCPQYHGVYKVPYQWQLELQPGTWQDLHKTANELLESSFSGLMSSSEVMITAGVKIAVDLDEMKAVLQGFQMNVRRLSTMSYTEGSGSLVHLTFWCWYFKDIHHRWAPYEPDKTQFILEKKFLYGQESYLFPRDKFHYRLSFKDMEQRNLETGKIRRVLRRPMYVSAEDVSQRRVLTHPCWLQQAPERNYDLPDHWAPLDILQPFELVSLDPLASSYREVSSQFYKTLARSRFSISCVYQVQNSSMWIKHCSQRRSMEDQADREGGQERVKEAMLFHGTDSEEVVRGICVNGFDHRVCGKNGTVYGRGAYFALEAKYSNNYTGKSKKKYMFLAKVLVGHYTKGNSDLTRPPVRVGHVLFDSCVNDLTNPTIYVLFDQNQAYPEYLIEYDDLRPPSPPSVRQRAYVPPSLTTPATSTGSSSATSSATGTAYTTSYRRVQNVSTSQVSTPVTAHATVSRTSSQPSTQPSASSQAAKDSKCVLM